MFRACEHILRKITAIESVDKIDAHEFVSNIMLRHEIILKNNDQDVLNTRKVWRYQSANQKPYTEEEKTIQWPKEENRQKSKQ